MSLFNQCTTQFRSGFSGPTGLDYAGVSCAAEAIGIDFKQNFAALQIMEREYLNIISEQQEKQRDAKKV